MSRYSTRDIPVRGGALRVGVWDGDHVADDTGPTRTVLAIHGITASHLAWPLVAERVTARPGTRVIAPDLRGRGRSADLPGPWGMRTHAADLAAVLDAFGIERALVLGHSMGAFVAVVFAHLFPTRATGLVLVDGGIPLAGSTTDVGDDGLAATLGPAAARLSMTFATRESYQRFWRDHPALKNDWSPAVAAYVDYDLAGGAPALHSSTNRQAVNIDAGELGDGALLAGAWAGLATDVTFLRAPRGLLAEPPGLYPRAQVAAWTERHRLRRVAEIPDVNHYTIVLAERGAAAVADLLAPEPGVRNSAKRPRPDKSPSATARRVWRSPGRRRGGRARPGC